MKIHPDTLWYNRRIEKKHQPRVTSTAGRTSSWRCTLNTHDFTTKDIQRFWSKVNIPDDLNACWEWQAGVEKSGFGQFGARSLKFKAHRIAYELCVGEIPDRFHVLQSCQNKRCCNPKHLSLHNFRDLKTNFWNKVNVSNVPDACWEWVAHRNEDGYGTFQSGLAHRTAYLIEFGSIPDGLYVLHTCDNPGCVNPKHLFLGTQQDNMDDMIAKGRQCKDNVAGVFTWSEVRDIRKQYSSENISIRQIADHYGVSYNAIWSIVTNRTWKE